jgi:hypothetical protein
MDYKTTKDFINEGSKEFIDIDSEIKRVYRFPNYEDIIINYPLKLCVTENGHRIWDAYGTSHYIPTGWIHLAWEVKEGRPNFIK